MIVRLILLTEINDSNYLSYHTIATVYDATYARRLCSERPFSLFKRAIMTANRARCAEIDAGRSDSTM